MKLSAKTEQLKLLVPAAGGLGLVLRILLYATGIDGRGLLKEGHWAGIAAGGLTVLVFAAVFLLTRPIDPKASDAGAPVSRSAAIGAFAAMVGIGTATVREFAVFSSRLHLIVWVLGLCTVFCLGYVGFCRLTGKRAGSLPIAVVCIYFALRLVSRYQVWSSVPELQDYCYLLSAYAALMLAAYHHAALEAGFGNLRAVWFYSLMGGYLCCLSLTEGTELLPLLGCGIWAFAGLPRPVMKPGKQDAEE